MGKHHAPLVIYGDDGERYVIGAVEIDLNPLSGEMEIVGEFTDDAITKQLLRDTGSYSIDWGSDV